MLATALVTVAAACFSLLAVRAYLGTDTPRAVVGNYFAAVASGDAADALSWSSTAETGPYLTATVLAQQLQLARLTDVQIGAVAGSDPAGSDAATVPVSYVLRFADVPVTVRDVVRLRRSAVGWRLASAAASGRLTPGAGADRVMLAGRRPPVVVALFPGAVPLSTDSPAVAISGHPFVTLADAKQKIPVNANLTAAARATVGQSVNQALRTCLDPSSAASGAAQPVDARCPVPDVQRVVPGSLRSSTVVRAVVTSTLGRSGIITVTARVIVTGRYRIWDFNNQVFDRSGRVALSVRAQLSVDQLATVLWQS